MFARRSSAVPFLTLGLLASTVSANSVIYNSVSPARPAGVFIINESDESDSRIEIERPGGARESDSRLGDVITFAGSDRFVTEFRVLLWATMGPPTAPVTVDVELNIYENVGGLPGATFWSGTTEGFSVARSNLNATPIDFFPNIMLPDSVCFAVAFANIEFDSTPPLFGIVSALSLPSVGSSPATVVSQASATGVWSAPNYGQHFRDPAVRVTAVPAPGIASVSAIGLLALTARRRRTL